jgi:hypothetical protein
MRENRGYIKGKRKEDFFSLSEGNYVYSITTTTPSPKRKRTKFPKKIHQLRHKSKSEKKRTIHTSQNN